MGELHAEFSIDQRARTAHIDLASNGTIVTTYSLANDVFTLSAISVNAVIDHTTLTTRVTALGIWLDTIIKFNLIPGKSQAEYEYEREVDAARIKFRMKFGRQDPIQLSFNRATRITTVTARSELILTADQFREYIYELGRWSAKL